MTVFARLGVFLLLTMIAGPLHGKDLILYNRQGSGLEASRGGSWRLVTDQVMGGVSAGTLTADHYQGKSCLRLQGAVSTANNGGFIQMALDLAAGENFDASAYSGIEITVAGNNEEYNLHLRTSDLWLPWQSYRASFMVTPQWQTIYLPFNAFERYKTSRSLRTSRLKRVGLVAIGREFTSDLRVAEIKLRSTP